MHSVLKTTLAATFCLMGGVGLATAQTATNQTASDTEVVNDAAYLILPIPMTEAQIASVNAEEGQGGGAAPGPYTGWTVVSADNVEVGKVTFSVQDPEGRIEYFNFVMPNDNRMRLTNGIAEMGEQMIVLRLTKAEVDANSTAPFTNVTVQ
jgi:hypothetical protein